MVIYRKIEDDPPPLRQFRPDLPASLEAICLRALSRRPEDRYPTTGAFADALRHWLESGEGDPTRIGTAAAPIGAAPESPRASEAPPAPPEPGRVRRRQSAGLSGPMRMALVTMAVWGALILGVVLLIRLLMPDG